MPTLHTGEVRLSYAVMGASRAGRRPLLMLAGPGFSGAALDIVTTQLGQQRQVIVLEPRGLGRSSRARHFDYGLEATARDVVAVLDSLGIARAHVAGVSVAGIGAQQAALLVPERVASLVLVSCHAPSPWDVITRTLRMGPLGVVRALSSEWMSAVCPCARAEDHRRYFQDVTAEIVRNSLRPDVLAATLVAGMRADLHQGLIRLRTPALVMTGSEDHVSSMEHAARLAAQMPRAELRVMEGAGHGMVLCHSEVVTRAMREFMGRHDEERELYAVS